MKGDSHRLEDRELGRDPAATTTNQPKGGVHNSPDAKGSTIHPTLAVAAGDWPRWLRWRAPRARAVVRGRRYLLIH
jgi:hypothetical protein